MTVYNLQCKGLETKKTLLGSKIPVKTIDEKRQLLYLYFSLCFKKRVKKLYITDHLNTKVLD